MANYRIREIATEERFSDEMTFGAMNKVVKRSQIEEALSECGIQASRVRKMDMLLTVMIVIGMGLFQHIGIGGVMKKMAKGVRLLWGDGTYEVAGDSAISTRRYQLGSEVLQRVFKAVCRPMASVKTKGAFFHGLRLMAIDGAQQDVANTPENVEQFGRHRGHKGDSAFPKLQMVYLCECGTHALVDAEIAPCHTHERNLAILLLRSLTKGMLAMWDRGLHSFDMLAKACSQGAQVLARLPNHAKPEIVEKLSDGSVLAYIYPTQYRRRKAGERILVRMITYTLTDPALPHAGEIHRLITTLLNPLLYPVLDLVCLYHERWEIEITIDEIETHLAVVHRPLRSLKPVGVIQELYGVLIAHYIIRSIMHDAALQANVDPDRLSFVGAINLIQDAIPEFQLVIPAQHNRLYKRLLSDIAHTLLPIRRHRINPRVLKKTVARFPVKHSRHYSTPQPASSFRAAVSLI
jgi:Insertion element 4 transposase N-terminal/Transposase DDE domain